MPRCCTWERRDVPLGDLVRNIDDDLTRILVDPDECDMVSSESRCGPCAFDLECDVELLE
jgi:hypothetical protein